MTPGAAAAFEASGDDPLAFLIKHYSKWGHFTCTGPGFDHRSRFYLRHQGRHTGAAGILRQLSGRQRQLRDRGGAGHSGAHEPGNGGRARHVDPFRRVARTRTRIGGRRHDLRERGVSALVGGAEHHSLYADPRQHPQKEQPILRSREFHVSTRKQQLSLSRGTATELWWPQHAEPHLCLDRDPQTLRSVCAQSPMHQRSVSLSCHPHGRTRPATRTGVGEHARICQGTKGKKKGGSPVRRTQESDRIASPAFAQIEVRAGAVLPGGSRPEHQATDAVPQPADHPCSASHYLAERREQTRQPSTRCRKDLLLPYFFNTHSRFHSSWPGGGSE